MDVRYLQNKKAWKVHDAPVVRLEALGKPSRQEFQALLVGLLTHLLKQEGDVAAAIEEVVDYAPELDGLSDPLEAAEVLAEALRPPGESVREAKDWSREDLLSLNLVELVELLDQDQRANL